MTTDDLTTERDAVRPQGRVRLKVLVTGTVAGILITLLAVASWSMIQAHLVTGDDFRAGVAAAGNSPGTTPVGGRRARDQAQLFEWCEAVAESTYGQTLFDGDGDWAPGSEQAFYAGCVGQPENGYPGD